MNATDSAPTVAADARAYRLTSIDLLRGLVVVIMALDHVRDFTQLGSVQDPMTDPHVSAAVFFTRWITHFCAPTFVFLAGTSAGLMAARKPPAALGAFLLTRGLWLLLVEMLVISTAFTFSPQGLAPVGGHTLVIMQVIWAIGASMLVLAGAQFLGRPACLAAGVLVIAGHNTLDAFWPASQAMDVGHPLWVALHAQMSVVTGPLFVLFGYPLLPWIGVMLAGFGCSAVFEQPGARRDALLLRGGLLLVATFVVVRLLDAYGDPRHWQLHAGEPLGTLMAFLNTTKYPPSLQFLLMTLGPAAIFCSFAERIGGALKEIFVTFGRVPFAFYVAHFYLIHALSIGIAVLQGFDAHRFLTLFTFYPKDYGLPLAGVYAVWGLVVVALYPLCRWMAGVKARRRDWWLSYL